MYSINTEYKNELFNLLGTSDLGRFAFKAHVLFFPPGKTFTGHRLIEKLVQVEIFADAMAKVKEAQRSSSIKEAVK